MDGAEREVMSLAAAVAQAFPKVALGRWPTPVTPMPAIARRAGVRSLAAKREDVSSPVYGGNKVRKLEFALGAARAAGAREVVTFGAVGSNHALATAVHASALGMRTAVFMTPQPPSHHVRRNLLAHAALGTRLTLCAGGEDARVSAAVYVGAEAERTGLAPAVVPLGGTDARGCVGVALAGLEFAAQVAAGEAESPDIVYVPFGSMGTAVGVAIGLAAAGLTPDVRAVRVTPPSFASAAGAADLAAETVELLATAVTGFPAECARQVRISVIDDFFGDGYGAFSPEGQAALREVREAEGLGLEGTYTAKTMAALLAHASAGELGDARVLYWHTYNSAELGGLLAGADHRTLPEPFHPYFEGAVQPLDVEEVFRDARPLR